MESRLENPDVQRLHDRVGELEEALADALQDLALTRAWIRLAQCRPTAAARPVEAFTAPEAARHCAN